MPIPVSYSDSKTVDSTFAPLTQTATGFGPSSGNWTKVAFNRAESIRGFVTLKSWDAFTLFRVTEVFERVEKNTFFPVGPGGSVVVPVGPQWVVSAQANYMGGVGGYAFSRVSCVWLDWAGTVAAPSVECIYTQWHPWSPDSLYVGIGIPGYPTNAIEPADYVVLAAPYDFRRLSVYSEAPILVEVCSVGGGSPVALGTLYSNRQMYIGKNAPAENITVGAHEIVKLTNPGVIEPWDLTNAQFSAIWSRGVN